MTGKPITVLIPYYSLFQAVGLIGSHVGLILTYLTGITPLLAWILMGNFATLPLVLALVFQRFITRLNIVDPITTRDI